MIFDIVLKIPWSTPGKQKRPVGRSCTGVPMSRLFDRGQEALADRGLAADDLDANLVVRDATGGNPIEAAALGHLKSQMPHVISDLLGSMQDIVINIRGQFRNPL